MGIQERFRDQGGQGLVEYALILMLIALFAIAALTFLGVGVVGLLDDIGSDIANAI